MECGAPPPLSGRDAPSGVANSSPKGGVILVCVLGPPLEVSSGGVYLSAKKQYNCGREEIYSMKKIANSVDL